MKMYINAFGHYIPDGRVNNEYFKQLNGLDDDWIIQRTGIRTRSKIGDNEDVMSMGIKAVEVAMEGLAYAIGDVDLIISAGYTITDTVGTLAHRVQREFNIMNAQVLAVTSACSSFVNAIEIAEGYFATCKSQKALIICSEANSVYNDYSNPKSGHLWGDGAVAVFVSKEKTEENQPQVLDIITKGLAYIGKGPDGVCLHPNNGGIAMNSGRDVFHYACLYMSSSMEELLQRNGRRIEEVSHFACHQANMRIVANIAEHWHLPESKFFNNIHELGNTGSASAMLALSQNSDKIKGGELVGLTVFGGGYSSGAMLIQF
ncbi:MAG: ketoacyl-ACP synthase III [Bacteroidales bacterium]